MKYKLDDITSNLQVLMCPNCGKVRAIHNGEIFTEARFLGIGKCECSTCHLPYEQYKRYKFQEASWPNVRL